MVKKQSLEIMIVDIYDYHEQFHVHLWFPDEHDRYVLDIVLLYIENYMALEVVLLSNIPKYVIHPPSKC